MGNLIVVGLHELRTLFGTYEQFVGDLCNVINIYDVRRSLWNGTQDIERKTLKSGGTLFCKTFLINKLVLFCNFVYKSHSNKS